MLDTGDMEIEQQHLDSDTEQRTLTGSLIPPLVMGLPKKTDKRRY